MSGSWFGVTARPLMAAAHRSRVARLGAWVRIRVEPIVPSILHVGDRTLGRALVVSPLAAVVAPPLIVGPMLAVVAVAVARARRASRRHDRDLTVGLADVLDQLALTVGAGLALPAAIAAVAPVGPPVYEPLLTETLRRLDDGASIADVLARLATELPTSARRAVAVLAAAVRDGTPVGAGLVHAASEARRARRRAVEADVRRLPVLLLVPLVSCVLPAFVLLTLVPLLLGSLEGLQFPDP
ncbi:MAG: type II secretion system F family protein [Actinomycetota bacterium]